MTRSSALPFVVILTSCTLLPAYAAGVHKWVDAKGTTHYSDKPPTSATTVVTLIEISTTRPTSTDAANDYYSIANQWLRLHKERIELDKIELSKAKQKTTQQQLTPRYVTINEPKETRYIAAFPRFSHHKHGYRRFHKRYRHFYGGSGRKHLRGHRRAGLHRGQISLGSYQHFE